MNNEFPSWNAVAWRIAQLIRTTPAETDLLKQHSFASAREPNEVASLLNDVIGRRATDSDMASEIFDELHKGARNHVVSIGFSDHNYPSFLRTIPDPPLVLYFRGNWSVLSGLPGLAVVGMRKSSPTGERIAGRIASYFSEAGYTIVSGLAMGIDNAAHIGALSAHGSTIAVMAHGLHKTYLKATETTAERILEGNGAWISEHPYGASPRKEFYVARNRLQTGLSAGSIIVEADVKSGSITQARFCLKQDRCLFTPTPPSSLAALMTTAGNQEVIDKYKGKAFFSRDDYGWMLQMLDRKRQELMAADPF